MTRAEQLSKLSIAQRADLERRLLARKQTIAIDPVGDDALPKSLTFAQEGLWFACQLAPERPVYNMPQAFRLSGPLNRAALELALQTIVARHSALRLRFDVCDGRPQQTVEARSIELSFADLSSVAAAKREGECQRRLEDEARRPFNLAEDLKLRAMLIRLGDDEHVFAVTLHHIVADFTSLGILFDELSALYNSASKGQGFVLPELPLSFAHWAERQRRASEGEAVQPSMAYWKARLSGKLSSLDMPVDHPRESSRASGGARQLLEIPAELAQALRDFAAREGVTLYMLLLAAFKVLLFRYSGQDDLVVGSPMDRRSEPPVRRVIGLFLNTLPLRTSLSGDPCFRELLGRVRETASGAFANQDVPFEQLVEALELPKKAGTTSLFQTMFQFLAAKWPAPALEGLRVSAIPVHSATAKFELTLTILESDSGFQGELEYDSGLYEPATISRLLANFQVLLRSILAAPDERISRLPLLSDEERRRLLVEWNQTSTAYPREASVPALFEGTVRERPEAVALVAEDQVVTYAELNRRANQLARYLKRQGVRPGQLAGVCLGRSIEAMISLLAVLKAGCAYLPLEPKFPVERLRTLAGEAKLATLVTKASLEQTAALGLDRILLDADADRIRSEDDADLPGEAGPEDLAYVMYTSGSTGAPKAVAVPHRAVVRLVKNTNYAEFGPEQTFLQFAPLTFDASTLEIWGPLLNGSRLVLFPEQFESLGQLAEVVSRSRVTTLWLTAGLFQQVVDEQAQALRCVRQLLAGGDVLSPPHIARALQQLPDCQLINGYGPTENTTFTCCYRFPREWPGTSAAPIGRPVSNTQVYILDPHLAPVPIGVRGELYAAGDGLARGYLNSLELTAETFVPNPFSDDPHAMMYRTGDHARYRSDGTIEFLGRADDQVKINGFRLHLSEVEIAMLEWPGVRQAAVVAVASIADGPKELVAYVAARPDLTASDLRAAASRALPAYMVPAHFVLLSNLPLTPNGKVDRRALPPINVQAHSDIKAPAPPETPQQAAILQVWASVFGRSDIGIDDNFFDLGGHSLLATRVVSRVQQALGHNVTLSMLFDAPTVRALADAVTRSGRPATPRMITRRPRGGATQGL